MKSLASSRSSDEYHTCEALVQSQALALAVDERDSNLRNKKTFEKSNVMHWN
jgi:hypothetical protein